MITASLLLVATVATSKNQALVVQRQSGKHHYTVQLETGPFRPHGRRLLWVRLDPEKDEFLPGYRSGGKLAVFGYGYELLGYPFSEIIHRPILKELEEHTEIRSLSLTVDGRRWVIRDSLIRDLLDPHSLREQLLTTIARDGKTIWIRNKGSVHGAAYWVKWILHRDGRQMRVDDDGPIYESRAPSLVR